MAENETEKDLVEFFEAKLARTQGFAGWLLSQNWTSAKLKLIGLIGSNGIRDYETKGPNRNLTRETQRGRAATKRKKTFYRRGAKNAERRPQNFAQIEEF